MTIKEVKLRIEQDLDGLSPREDFDNVGTMVCWHGLYDLGDEQPNEAPEDYLARLAHRSDPDRFDRIDNVLDRCPWKSRREEIVEEYRRKAMQDALSEHYLILPLYLYDHSGITISTAPFSCSWDSGQVGFIYCSRQRINEEWNGDWEAAERYLKGEVETYDQYLRGDVWGYVIEDGEGNELDSCWGFYGLECCEEEGEAELAYWRGKEKEAQARVGVELILDDLHLAEV
jgi:hypothetical protein